MAEKFLRRVVGAALLRADAYKEIEADHAATPEAFAIVVLSALAASIGSRGWAGGAATASFFAVAGTIAVLTWATLSLVTFEIGARMLPPHESRADVGVLLRALGFAAAPGVIQVLGLVPRAAAPVFAVAIVWALAATVVAVRQALDDSSTGRALAVCALALAVTIVVAAVIGLLSGRLVSGF